MKMKYDFLEMHWTYNDRKQINGFFFSFGFRKNALKAFVKFLDLFCL